MTENTTEAPSLREFINAHIEIARETLKKNGNLLPTFVGETVDGEVVVIHAPFDYSHEQKNAAVQFAKLIFLSRNVYRYVFYSEAWMSHQVSVEPRFDKERKEVVTVHAESREEALFGHFDIIRAEDEEIKDLGEFILKERDEACSGRFQGLLPPEHLANSEAGRMAAELMLQKMGHFTDSPMDDVEKGPSIH